MITRQKLAAGLGGLTLMLGTLGGAAAVHAASPPATAPTTIVQPAQADTETADGPDTDNVQDGSGSQVEDGTPDVPGAVGP